jgi:hypothetical protein
MVFVEVAAEKRYVRYEERQKAEEEGNPIEDTFELKIKKISLLEELLDEKTQIIHVNVNTEDVTTAFTDTLKTLAKLNPGKSALEFQITDDEHQCVLDMPSRTLCVQAKPFIDGLFEKYPAVRIKIN